MIHLEGARCKANEIELARPAPPGMSSGSTRARVPCCAGRSAQVAPQGQGGRLVDWPRSSRSSPCATAPCRYRSASCGACTRPNRRPVERLHEEAKRSSGRGSRRELEADVFEELDTEHQLEFLRARSDEEAARLLSAMAPTTPSTCSQSLTKKGAAILTRLPPPAGQTSAFSVIIRDRRGS